MGRAHPQSFLCLGQLGCRGQVFLAVLFSAEKGSFVTPTQFNYIHFEPHRYSLHCTTGRKCGQHTPNTSPQVFLFDLQHFKGPQAARLETEVHAWHFKFP